MGNTTDTPLPADEHKQLHEEFDFVVPRNIIQTIYTRYKRVRTLGEGATCKVVQCTNRSDHSQVAIKKMNRTDDHNAKLFKREYRILRKLVHPSILSFRDVFIDQKSFCIVTELCTGGRLLDRVRAEAYMSERKVWKIVSQLLSAIQFMHQHNIVHRDLKPENIVYDRAGRDGHVVIIDFGCAREISDPSLVFKDFVGTEDFMAPETIKKRPAEVLKKCDMWSLGVITYLLLTGRLPFHGETRKKLFTNICQKDYVWPPETQISDDCASFVNGLLKRNHRRRMTSDDALRHDWVQTTGSLTDHDLGRHVLKHVATYKSGPRLKQLLVDVAVAEMDDIEKQIISNAFGDILHTGDSDMDGGLDKETLRSFYMKQGLDEGNATCRADQFFERFGRYDRTESGRLTFDDFIRMHVADQYIADDKYLETAFNRLDNDQDGLISTDDLTRTLSRMTSRELPPEFVEGIVDECAQDWGHATGRSEHHISLHEFTYAMKKLDSKGNGHLFDGADEFTLELDTLGEHSGSNSDTPKAVMIGDDEAGFHRV